MAKENFYISKQANDPETTKRGFTEFIALCHARGFHSAWLVTAYKENVIGTMIEELVGRVAAKELVAGKSLPIGGVSFTLRTKKTTGYSGNGRPALVVWVAEKQLEALDGLADVPLLFVIPWVMSQVEAWVRTRGPIDALGEIQPSAQPNQGAVVEAALHDIAGSINMRTGVINPNDKKTVIDAFKILQKGGEHYDPDDIQAWFVRKGMPAKYAAEVAKIAANPSGFRAARADSMSYLGSDPLKRWRTTATSKAEPD